MIINPASDASGQGIMKDIFIQSFIVGLLSVLNINSYIPSVIELFGNIDFTPKFLVSLSVYKKW